jgi:hypothetical protein
MTTRRLVFIECCGEEAEDNEMKYIESFEQGSIDPMDIEEELDSEGLPILPEGTKTLPAGEGIDGGPGGKLVPPEKLWDLVDKTIAGTYTFHLPTSIYTCKDEWLAFRFKGGKLYGRSATQYEDLHKSQETEFIATYSDEIEDNTCFAVKSELLRTCYDIAGDKIVVSVNGKKNSYIGIRTPDLTCVFFCPPLILEENLKVPEEEKSGAPENQETVADAEELPSETVEEEEVDESEAETEGSEVEEQEGGSEEEEAAEETETEDPEASSDGDVDDSDAEAAEEAMEEDSTTESNETEEPTEPKPAAEDVDPLEAYDTLIPDLIKVIQETVKEKGNEAKRVLKNATKQSRKAIKSQADPAEVADLKRKLASETKRADKAEKELGELKAGLAFLKSKV